MDINDKVEGLIAEQLGVERERVAPDSNLIDDLGADSLDVVELAMEVEDEFRIDIPDGEESDLKTVRDWQERVEREIAAK